MLLDIFTAGTDTTSNTIEWATEELLRHLDKLKKAQAVLEQFIGKENIVEEGEIAKLPYLQAIVKETFWLHPLEPLLLPRKVDTDVELCGFTVPKNANDAKFWENPDLFEPERFLGCNIDIMGQDFELITFGGGPRICPDIKGQDFELITFGGGPRICRGLSLANKTVHLMLGLLIHSFKWKLEDGNETEIMDMDEKFGITLLEEVSLGAIPLSI
ncbi:hypothetical protein Nepgr_028464 [Nepenthes gracilis]|uniref:Cytochrome P450 n=1 Tax=Nepenthes gracilis TaxID=150966 RepID=A0AAD3TCL1_NEPGR|nr:hypothetical protein Nepgr_028464 [Nepenthes gracilis]